MKKKCTLIIALFVPLLFIILLVATFYSIPFVKINETIVYSNKTNNHKIENNDFIAQENYEKMCVVNRKIHDNEYVQIKTKNNYKICTTKKIKMACSVTATVNSLDEVIAGDVYKGDFIVVASFEDGKWHVTEVQ